MHLILLLALLLPSPSRAEPPCPGLAFAGEEIGLDGTEKRLVCGDPDSRAWRKVPAAQARHFLRVILQNRGYHSPSFRSDGDTLTVDIGTRTVVSDFLAEGLPVEVDPGKYRGFAGEPLTPKVLDRAEAALSSGLRQNGYACPEVKARGEQDGGVIRAHAVPGDPARLDRIVDPHIPGIDSRIFRRYEAFRRGQPFDERLLAVTSDRIVREALFLSAFFDVDCGSRPPAIVLRAVAAPPQIVRVGVGVDSEGLARVRAQWQHSRIGGRASSMETTLHGSVREQSFESFLRLYPGPASRVYLRPRVYAARVDEARYETVGGQVSVSPAVNWDFETLGAELKTGPAVDDVRTVRGLGIPRETYLSWETQVSVLSHLYERYLAEPRAGWQANVAMSSRFAGTYSEITAHRLKFTFQKLWNVGRYEPPLLVVGSRGLAAATWILDESRTLGLLPPAYRHYLGGDADYRGLGRGELPGEALGYLTAVYHGLEVRAGDWLPGRLQPYVFFDTAMGGGRRFQALARSVLRPRPGLALAVPGGHLARQRGARLRAPQRPGDVSRGVADPVLFQLREGVLRRAPLAVKIILAGAGAAAVALVAAALLLLLKPGLLINSRTAAWALKNHAAAWEPRWRVLNLKAWAPSLREKELILTASDICFRHAESGSDGCLNVLDVHLAVSVWPPRLLRVDRFILGSNRLRIIVPAATEPREGGFSLPAPLLGAKPGLIRVELEKLELRSGARAVSGSVKASFDASRTRPLALRADLSVDGRPLRAEAFADTSVFPSGGLRTLDALWSGSFAGSGEASGRVKAAREEDGGEAEVAASGTWTASSSSAPVRSVKLGACRGAARTRPSSLAPESLRADCAVILTPGRAAPVREVRGLASVRARFDREDGIDVEAGLDLEPVRDWYEASGRLRVRVEGRLGRLSRARLTHELALRLSVPRFEELGGRLEGTALELPAALRPFRGPVELELEGSGDPRRRDHRFTLRGRSKLAAGAQRLAASVSGTLDVRDPLLPERSARAAANVSFDDIALDVPRLDGEVSSSTAAIVGRLNGKASVSAVFPRGDEFTAGATVDLGPVKDWYEASGRLRLRVEGRLAKLREARVEQDFEARLAVPRFEDVVARLRETALAVPAPLNVLKGAVEATARGSGDPRRGEQRLQLSAGTRLAEGRQRLFVSAEADVTMREILLPSRSAEAKASVVLEDVALELPRLEVGAPPDVTLDKRIAPAAQDAPRAGPARAAWLKFEAKVATAKPALLHTNLAQAPVPVGLDLVVRSGEPPLSGRIWLERFETILFRRTASIERFVLTPLSAGLFELDGMVLAKTADAVVRILILGTTAKPRVDISSEPPLSRPQIISLLLFNKPPDQLDAGQNESVGHAQGALASDAFGLASLYLFASTPIEYVGYDPTAQTASLRLRVPGGATVELGASRDETKHVRLRKRLAAHWALQTEVRTREREGNIVTTFLEWYNRF